MKLNSLCLYIQILIWGSSTITKQKTILSKIWRLTLGTVAIAIILLAVTISAARLALPFASDYREQLQTWVGNYFASDITFEQLNIKWHRFSPRLVLENVHLGRGNDKAQQLQLDEVFIDFDVWNSLTFGRVRIQDISLEGVHLKVERFANGRVSVQGVDLIQNGKNSAAKRSDNAGVELLNTLFVTDIIRLKKASVHIVDHQTDLGELNIHLADLVIKNKGGSHSVFASISLPDQLGESLTINAEFLGEAQKPGNWAGQFYLNANHLKVPAWLALLPEQKISADQGNVSIEAWGKWDQLQITSLQAKTNVDNLQLKNGAVTQGARQSWQLQSFSAHSLWQQQAAGWSLDVDEMKLTTEDKMWEPSGFSLRYQNDAQQLTGDIKLLHAESIAALLQFSHPSIYSLFSNQVNRQLAQIIKQKPEGEIRNLNFKITGADSAQNQTQAQIELGAEFTRLGMIAIKKIPGFRGISGTVFVKDQQAYLSLDTRRASIYISSLFRTPWPISKLTGMLKLDWRDETVSLISPSLDIQNNDLQANAKLSLLFPPGRSPELDIQGHFIKGDGSQVSRYLPVGIMAPKLVEWLDDAIVSGDLTQGSLLLRGPAKSFPFRDHSGVFDIAFDAKNTQLTYHPDWPGLTGIDAAVQFYNAGMAITASKGFIQHSSIQQTTARIDDFRQSLLVINGSVQSEIPNLIDFVNESPLDKKIGAFFRSTEGTGSAQVDLNIDIPIKNINQTQLKGVIKLNKGQLRIVPARLNIDAIAGEIEFTESSFSIDNMQAQHAGESLTVNAYPVINNNHRTSNISVRTAIDLGEKLKEYAVPIPPLLVGKSNWAIDLLFPETQVEGDAGKIKLIAKSDLKGVSIDLPAPFKKSADSILPFKLTGPISSDPESRWRFDLANRVRGLFELSSHDNEVNLARGHLQFGSPKVLQLPTASTIFIDGKINEVNIDEWIRFNDQLTVQADKGQSLAMDVDLQFDLASSKQLHLLRGRAQLKSTAAGLSGEIQSDEIKGDFQVSKPAAGPRLVTAKVDYINLDTLLLEQDDEASLEIKVENIPSLNLQVKRLDWGKAHLNKLRFRSVTNEQTLTIQEASFQNNNIRLRGTGNWAQIKVSEEAWENQSSLALTLQSNNFGKGLSELGLPGILNKGKGEIASSLEWDSALLSPEIAGLSGKVTVSLRDGMLTSIEPGSAKLVGLFALKALPKRLFLDFSDISEAGLPFDLMTGNVYIKDGIAASKNAQITGPVARIKLKGEADLVAQTYDQKITALPNLGASLPIIGVLAGGVVTGALALVADTALKDMGLDIDQLAQIEYSLTGSWEDPVLQKIQRPDGDAEEGAQ